MLLEHGRLHIGLFHHRVDDGELGLGELVGNLLERGFLAETDGHDRAVSLAREPAQGLLPLRIVLRLEIAVIRTRLLLVLLSARMDAFIEGFVELASEVVDDRRLESVLREDGGRGDGEAREREGEAGGFHRQCSLSGPDL